MDSRLKRIDKTTRLRIGRSGGEPAWCLGTTLSHAALPVAVVEWLYDADSLTKRLKQACGGRFQVRLLEQAWQRPMRCERRLLGLGERELALVRQVCLLCGGRVVVFARTVLPRGVLRSRYRYLARLGGKPLGEVLFRDLSMRRSEVQLARIDDPRRLHPALADCAGQAPVWGRRSLFRLGGQPLLVSEVFVAPPPALPPFRFRVTRKSGR